MLVERRNTQMGILYWNGIAPEFLKNNYVSRVFLREDANKKTFVATLHNSEQWREVSFWLGRVSDMEEAP